MAMLTPLLFEHVDVVGHVSDGSDFRRGNFQNVHES